MTPNTRAILSKLRGMDGYEFEQKVAQIWADYGWDTSVTQASNDGGIDMVAEKSFPIPQKHLIQAKKYGKNNTIGSEKIQQYSSLRHQHQNVDSVVIVTTSSFTTQAEEFAEQLNVKLVDGNDLVQVIQSSEDGEAASNQPRGKVKTTTNRSVQKKSDNSDGQNPPADEIKIKVDVIPAYKEKIKKGLVSHSVHLGKKLSWNNKVIEVTDTRPSNEGELTVTEDTHIRFCSD